MAHPLVVLVFVVSSDSGTPATAAIVDATRIALDGALVVLRPVAAFPADDDALSTGAQVHADAVVEVSWSLPDRSLVHLHVGANKRWSDRELTFGPTDDSVERGRAVGLAIATMVPATDEPPIAAPAPHPAPPILVPVESSKALDRPRYHLELDAAFAAATGASGLGYEVGAHLRAPTGWFVSAGLGARFGRIEAAAADATTVRLSAGVGLDVVHTERFVAGIALDGLALRSDLHRRENGQRVEHARWVPGFDVLATAGFSMTETLGFFLSAGLELGFGQTAVVIGDEQVTTIPRVRTLVISGLRLRF